MENNILKGMCVCIYMYESLSCTVAINTTPWVNYVKVTQSCPTLCDPMDSGSPGSSVHGILPARILDWVAISFSKGSSWLRDWTWVSHIVGRFFTIWTINYTSIFLKKERKLDSLFVFLSPRKKKKISSSIPPLNTFYAFCMCSF